MESLFLRLNKKKDETCLDSVGKITPHVLQKKINFSSFKNRVQDLKYLRFKRKASQKTIKISDAKMCHIQNSKVSSRLLIFTLPLFCNLYVI